MQFLSSAVSLYDPPNSPPILSDDPKLIVVCSWMAARELHIAKYITQHRVLFPTSRILLVRFPIDHVFYPRGRDAQLQPSLPLLREAAEENDGKVLMHVFSNGGVSSVVKLVGMLSQEGLSLPRHVMVMDSCPAYFHWNRTHLAISQVLPSWASPLVHVGMAFNWLLFAPFGYLPPTDENANRINAPEMIALQERRTYVYGDADEVVDWKDVEDHAATAREKGGDVRLEKFDGGRHVAHVRVDAESYWRVVRETWEGK